MQAKSTRSRHTGLIGISHSTQGRIACCVINYCHHYYGRTGVVLQGSGRIGDLGDNWSISISGDHHAYQHSHKHIGNGRYQDGQQSTFGYGLLSILQDITAKKKGDE